MLRVAIKNVVVTRCGRAAPNVRSVEASILHIAEILNEDCMVRFRSIAFWFKILHGVQIGNIDSSLVRGWTFVAIFINVESEEKRVDAMDLLK